ncbi:MAG: hypothetical protein ACR2H5_13425, partial [Ktedonobacteraceae bacterium]
DRPYYTRVNRLGKPVYSRGDPLRSPWWRFSTLGFIRQQSRESGGGVDAGLGPLWSPRRFPSCLWDTINRPLHTIHSLGFGLREMNWTQEVQGERGYPWLFPIQELSFKKSR